MQYLKKFSLVLAPSLLAAGASIAHASPVVIDTFTAEQDSCLSVPAGQCMTTAYPSGSLIAQQRYVTAPTGNVAFHVHVVGNGPGPTGLQIDGGGAEARAIFVYTVTVTAKGPHTNQVVSNATTVTLSGQDSTDVTLPLDIEWAESDVNITVVMYQQACPKQTFNAKTHVLAPACTYTSGAAGGPNLSAINFGNSIPWTLASSDFVLLVTPAAAFQAPVTPVAIVYAPLGNMGHSSLALTDTTATNQTITDQNGTAVSAVNDTKTSTTFSLSGGGMGGGTVPVSASLGWTFSGTWDNAGELDEGQSQQITGSILTQNQINASFAAAATPVPLDQVTYSTQPFWHDVILAAVDAKYALWAYTSGPVIQPIGNAGLAMLDILQLDSCYRDTSALNPYTDYLSRGRTLGGSWQPGTSFLSGSMIVTPAGEIEVATTGGQSGANMPAWSANEGASLRDGHVIWQNETDHFVTYAGSVTSGTSTYQWLTSDDCLNLANLDPFYVAKSQSAHPASYRTLTNGSSILTSAPVTFSNTDTSTQSVTTASTSTWASKVTSIGTSSQETDVGVTLLLFLGLKYSDVQSSTATFSNSVNGSAVQQAQTTYTGAAAASTTIQDSTGESVPVNVLQDSLFQGVAVQDTAMHFTDQGAPVPQSLAIPAGTLLPIVDVGQAAPATGGYVQKTRYGYVTVTR
ncbi:MAG TPA: hypothetical protein VGM88_23335 [Kofleriaceae bacterium]